VLEFRVFTYRLSITIMNAADFYKNVHGVEEFYIVYEDANVSGKQRREAGRSDIPVLASTVQKSKLWIREVMLELQCDNAPGAYHGMRAVLHTLRDRLTVHEAADFASQLPMLLRGLFYEGWQPEKVPVKDRNKEDFISHVAEAFPGDQTVDPERLTRAVLKVVAHHVSDGEMQDIQAIIPKSLGELFPKNVA
jgi:uncharacterized protein (DUF2267 family)